VVFSKFDARDDEAYEALKNEGIPPDNAVIQAASRATKDFQKTCIDLPIFTSRYPPKNYVTLRGKYTYCMKHKFHSNNLKIDMNFPASHCSELVKKTAAALDTKALQALFISTQRNKIELCFAYAIKCVIVFSWGLS
jgi:hypothetical protein